MRKERHYLDVLSRIGDLFLVLDGQLAECLLQLFVFLSHLLQIGLELIVVRSIWLFIRLENQPNDEVKMESQRS